MLSTIRKIRIEEVRKVIEFTMQFKSSFLDVDLDYCSSRYEKMIESGISEIFINEIGSEIAASLGFIKAPDITNGRLTFIETFWFASEKFRGAGIRIFNKFEKYAAECGANQIAMIHLSDSYPDKLKNLYTKRGYKLVENHYIKYLGV